MERDTKSASFASASADEGAQIQAWVTQEMPRIPKVLAECFAWYVTRGLNE